MKWNKEEDVGGWDRESGYYTMVETERKTQSSWSFRLKKRKTRRKRKRHKKKCRRS